MVENREAQMRRGDPGVLEMFFEFASPYAYFASREVESLCARHGLELVWRPVMLGAIFKHTGSKPLLSDGVRGDYATMDCLRWARRHDIPFFIPDNMPTNSLKAARGVLWYSGRSAQAAFIHACFRAHWVEGGDLFDDALLAGVVAQIGEDPAAFSAAIAEPAIKQRLIDATEAARLRGVFGAPTFCYKGEWVWGNDRMGLLEEIIRDRPPNNTGSKTS